MWRWFRSVSRALTLVLAVGLAVAARTTPAAEPLRVAMTGDYWPMHRAAGGQAEGFEADLASLLGLALQREVVFVDPRALGLTTLAAVAAGRADIGMSAITPTADRARTVRFTTAYLQLKVSMAGLKASASADLEHAALAVSTDLVEAVVRKALPSAQIVRASAAEGVVMATSGRVLAVVGEDVGLLHAIRGSPLILFERVLGLSPIAAALPLGADPAPFDAVFAAHAAEIAALAEKWRVGRQLSPQSAASAIRSFPTMLRRIGYIDGRWVEQSFCDDAGNSILELNERDDGWYLSRYIGRHLDDEMTLESSIRIVDASVSGTTYTFTLESKAPIQLQWPYEGDRRVAAGGPHERYATAAHIFPFHDGDCDNY